MVQKKKKKGFKKKSKPILGPGAPQSFPGRISLPRLLWEKEAGLISFQFHPIASVSLSTEVSSPKP